MVVTNQQAVARPRIVGRYALFDEIAAGGMATIHLGRLVGPVGFSRTVAIKTLHPQFAKDPEFVEMFLEEARLASRIQHPNVISTLDVATGEGEVFLVMEYVAGESLAKLVRSALKKGELMPVEIATSVLAGMLHGLHATHEAKNEQLEAMHIVHRDVSPQNVLVGLDGVARIFDFGVAKAAAMRSQVTSDGQMKGKLSYMSPEQLNSREVDRRTDVFAAGVVAWECLTGKRLFAGSDPGEVLAKVLTLDIAPPIEVQSSIPRTLSDTVMRALERSPEQRWQTARDFAIELERSTPLAAAHVVGDWVELNASDAVQDRRHRVESVERASVDLGHISIPAQASAAHAIAAHALATSVLAANVAPAPQLTVVEAQPASGPRDAAPVADASDLANAGSAASRSSHLTVSSSAEANEPSPARRRAVLFCLLGCAAAALAVALWHWQQGGFDEPAHHQPSPAANLPEPPTDVRTVPTPEPAPSPSSAPPGKAAAEPGGGAPPPVLQIDSLPVQAEAADAGAPDDPSHGEGREHRTATPHRAKRAGKRPPAKPAPGVRAEVAAALTREPKSSAAPSSPAAATNAPAGAPKTAPVAPKPECDPPWYIDAKGIQRFWPKCL